MNRILIGTLLAMAAAAPLKAAEPSAKIVEYGRYSAEITGLRPVTGTSGSVLVQSTNVVHVETTTRVPAKVGAAVGMRYELFDLPVGRDIAMKSIMRHPPIKQPDGTVITVSQATSTIKAGVIEAGQSYYRNSRWYFVNPSRSRFLSLSLDFVEASDQLPPMLGATMTRFTGFADCGCFVSGGSDIFWKTSKVSPSEPSSLIT